MTRRLPLLLTLAALAACDDGSALDPLDAAPIPDAALDLAVDAAPPDARLPPIPDDAWLLDVEAPLPRWLSDTGIFTDIRALTPRAGLVPYAPPHPLYSNGTTKHRLLYLPPGEAIEPHADGWRFPIGTVLVKTFAYDDVEGRAGTVPIETRISVHRADGWSFGEYHHNVEGDEARLVGGSWTARPITLDGPDGPFTYTLPGLLECRGCHETAASPVLGITRDNLDPTLSAEIFTEPPATAEIIGRTDAETDVMRYLVGNCVHCHHGGEGENASFDLRPDVLVAETVGRPTNSSASGDGIRVVPGDAEASALWKATVDAHRPDYDGDFKPMPPIGIDRADDALPALLRAWIEELAP